MTPTRHHRLLLLIAAALLLTAAVVPAVSAAQDAPPAPEDVTEGGEPQRFFNPDAIPLEGLSGVGSGLGLELRTPQPLGAGPILLRDDGSNPSDDSDDSDSDEPPAVPQGDDFIQVAALDDYCFGLRRGGALVAWSQYGVEEGFLPEAKHAGPFVNGRFASLTATHEGMCATTRSGLHTCWGEMWFDGVEALATWAVTPRAPTSEGSLGVGADGSLQCVGDEAFCQRAPLGGQWRDVACAHSGRCCGVLATGAVRCWGYNTARQGPSEPLAQVSLGSWRACGVGEDGALRCWGLGAEEHESARAPAGQFAQVAVSEEGDAVCGVQVDGALVCWGEDSQQEPWRAQTLAQGVRQVALSDEGTCWLNVNGTVSARWEGDLYDGAPDDDDDIASIQAAGMPLLALSLDTDHKALAQTLWGDDDDSFWPWITHLGDQTPQTLRDLGPADAPRRDGVQVKGAPSAWMVELLFVGDKPTWVGLDLLTQRPRWRVNAPSPDAPRCAMQSGDTVAVVLSDTAYGIDAKTGATRWTLRGLSDGDRMCDQMTAPGHQAGLLRVVTDPSALSADFGPDTAIEAALQLIDPRTGKARWTTALDVPVNVAEGSGLWVGPDVALILYQGDDTSPGVLRAFSAQDGAERWRLDPKPGRRLLSFEPLGEVAWVVSVEVDATGARPTVGFVRHTVEAVGVLDGVQPPALEPLALDVPAGGDLWTQVSAGVVMVVSTADGLLRAFDPANGQPLWAWGVGPGVKGMQALTSAAGAWAVVYVDYTHPIGDGALLIDLNRPPAPVEVEVEGRLDRWGALLIGGQRVVPFPRDRFRATLTVGGWLRANGFFSDCADGAAGTFDTPLRVTPGIGYVWLAPEWSDDSSSCP